MVVEDVDFDFPFLVSNFSKLDSTEITINDEYKRYKYTDFSEDKIGDYIICRVNNFKTIKRGNYYRVENKKINIFGYVSIKFENILNQSAFKILIKYQKRIK